MSVDPHKYSAGPGIFQHNSYFWWSSEDLQGQKPPRTGLQEAARTTMSLHFHLNIHHGKGQQSCNCRCSSTSQPWRDTKSTRIHSHHLYPLSVVAESQMWSTSEHKRSLQCFSFVTTEAKQSLSVPLEGVPQSGLAQHGETPPVAGS